MALTALGVGLGAACTGPSTTPAAAELGPPQLEVLGTKVEPPVSGLPVVAIHVRGPVLAQSPPSTLDVFFEVAVATDPTLGSPSCGSNTIIGTPIVPPAAGTLYPAFLTKGPQPAGVRDGWITGTLLPSAKFYGRCLLKFTLQAAWQPVSVRLAATSPPGAESGIDLSDLGTVWFNPDGTIWQPNIVDVATLQVRNDGSDPAGTPYPPTERPTTAP